MYVSKMFEFSENKASQHLMEFVQKINWNKQWKYFLGWWANGVTVHNINTE